MDMQCDPKCGFRRRLPGYDSDIVHSWQVPASLAFSCSERRRDLAGGSAGMVGQDQRLLIELSSPALRADVVKVTSRVLTMTTKNEGSAGYGQMGMRPLKNPILPAIGPKDPNRGQSPGPSCGRLDGGEHRGLRGGPDLPAAARHTTGSRTGGARAARTPPGSAPRARRRSCSGR